MPKVGKPKSKRVPVRLRHKIEKASAAKQRKQRKLAKKDPQWRSKIKKDPGIPNLFPYKDKILEQIEERKQEKALEQQQKREKAQLARRARGREEEDDHPDVEGASFDASLADEEDDTAMDAEGQSSDPMAALLASARARAAEYDEKMDVLGDRNDAESDGGFEMNNATEQSAKSYANLFETVLSSADIILYVLDARDPPSTRSVAIERQIAAFSGGTKRLLLILNKIDLVPPQVLKGWLTFLRRYHPTIPLRASPPAPNAKVFDHKALTQRATAETLLRALKAYSVEQNFKRAITVGVVGYPNVGKSSVINSLVSCLGRRNAPATTGAEAGVTTTLKTIKLDNKVTLLDSPGVIFPDNAVNAGVMANGVNEQEDPKARLVLLNALPPKAISDPIPAITLLLSRLSQDSSTFSAILNHYGAPELMSGAAGDQTTDFLVQVARKRGRLGRGGVPNLESAAMCVLGDWRDGRIPGWREPPLMMYETGGRQDRSTAPMIKGDEKHIVNDWAEEFKIDGLWDPSQYEQEDDRMES